MARKLDYRWNLRQVMASRDMFQTTDLAPLLAERGIGLSSSQVYRLVTERPERLSLKVLMALLDILDCSMEDLIEPAAAVKPARKAKTASGEEAGVGVLRPPPSWPACPASISPSPSPGSEPPPETRPPTQPTSPAGPPPKTDEVKR